VYDVKCMGSQQIYRIFVEVGRIELPSEQTVQTASTCVDYYLYLT